MEQELEVAAEVVAEASESESDFSETDSGLVPDTAKGGHSKTTFTKGCLILTTYPRVDNCGHFTHYLLPSTNPFFK